MNGHQWEEEARLFSASAKLGRCRSTLPALQGPVVTSMFMFSAKNQGNAAALTIDLPEFLCLATGGSIVFSFSHFLSLVMQLGALAITPHHQQSFRINSQ